MTPDQFLREISQRPPAPAYLFLGPEAYQRRRCRRALIEKVLGDQGQDDSGFSHHDLDQGSLVEALDDARAMSLFTTRRLIWIDAAEAVLPKRASSEDAQLPASKELASYLKNPTPDVTVVFDSRRFGFDGDDKARIEKVANFYSIVRSQVEFRPLEAAEARALGQRLVKESGARLDSSELALLLEACDNDALRIANEIEKLALYAGKDRAISAGDIEALVPNARSSSIFSLVSALGRGDRSRSLDILDTLVRDGEYLPLALAFLATQFRYALIAHEAGLRNSQQIQNHFTRLGIRMWRDRAEQVAQTVQAFSRTRVENAIRQTFLTDRNLRDIRPDDRTVFENFILALTQ